MSVLTGRRGRVTAVGAALLALMVPTASHAITNGTPTTAYTNVGSFVVEVTPQGGEPYLLQLCTGTMVSAHVVLTASHCMDRGDYAPDLGTVWFTLAPKIGSGSWQLDDGLPLLTGTPVAHPDYTGLANYRYDVGAFVLDTAVSGVPFARLAPLGYLDDNALRGDALTMIEAELTAIEGRHAEAWAMAAPAAIGLVSSRSEGTLWNATSSLARIAAHDHPAAAAQLVGIGLGALQRMGSTPGVGDLQHLRDSVRAAPDALGSAEFDRLVKEGRALAGETAVARVLDLLADPTPA